MTIALSHKVKRTVQTDEGFIFLYDEDFAEGGTREEAILNLTRRIAVVNREIRRSKKMPVNEFKVLNKTINLN